jgi:RpiB/LacA/LacB family sugar-phosphate isomerase
MSNYLVIPLAGYGRRFRNLGYDKPKQMLEAVGVSNFEYSLRSIDTSQYEIIIILREQQVAEEGFIDFIAEKCQGMNYRIHTIPRETRGSLETVLTLENLIDSRSTLTIFTMDVSFRKPLNPETFSSLSDGGVLTFKSNSPNYSYAKNEGNKVLETAEKIVISDQALVGVYFFRQAGEYFKFARLMIANEDTTSGEFYIAPVYNYLIRSGMLIESKAVDEFYVFGTPEEFEFFKNYILRNNNKKIYGLCSDHSGVDLKITLSEILDKLKIPYIDFGTYSHQDCDYNDYVNRAVDSYLRGEIDLILGTCKSGQGVSIAAGAREGVLPTVIYSKESAGLAISHNCSNFLSFPSSVWENNNTLNDTIEKITSSRFEGGRHQLRLMKVVQEKKNA